MGHPQTLHKVSSDVSEVIPDEREYTEKENARLDDELCDAIRAAEEAGNEYLVDLLTNELGSHYYGTR